ncbi:hypothetical protein K0U07_03170 [bacterium]|nr:hypothetical protein [bacterium]
MNSVRSSGGISLGSSVSRVATRAIAEQSFRASASSSTGWFGSNVSSVLSRARIGAHDVVSKSTRRAARRAKMRSKRKTPKKSQRRARAPSLPLVVRARGGNGKIPSNVVVVEPISVNVVSKAPGSMGTALVKKAPSVRQAAASAVRRQAQNDELTFMEMIYRGVAQNVNRNPQMLRSYMANPFLPGRVGIMRRVIAMRGGTRFQRSLGGIVPLRSLPSRALIARGAAAHDVAMSKLVYDIMVERIDARRQATLPIQEEVEIEVVERPSNPAIQEEVEGVFDQDISDMPTIADLGGVKHLQGPVDGASFSLLEDLFGAAEGLVSLVGRVTSAITSGTARLVGRVSSAVKNGVASVASRVCSAVRNGASNALGKVRGFIGGSWISNTFKALKCFAFVVLGVAATLPVALAYVHLGSTGMVIIGSGAAAGMVYARYIR